MVQCGHHQAELSLRIINPAPVSSGSRGVMERGARANTANYNSSTTHGLQSAINWYLQDEILNYMSQMKMKKEHFVTDENTQFVTPWAPVGANNTFLADCYKLIYLGAMPYLAQIMGTATLGSGRQIDILVCKWYKINALPDLLVVGSQCNYTLGR